MSQRHLRTSRSGREYEVLPLVGRLLECSFKQLHVIGFSLKAVDVADSKHPHQSIFRPAKDGLVTADHPDQQVDQSQRGGTELAFLHDSSHQIQQLDQPLGYFRLDLAFGRHLGGSRRKGGQIGNQLCSDQQLIDCCTLAHTDL